MLNIILYGLYYETRSFNTELLNFLDFYVLRLSKLEINYLGRLIETFGEKFRPERLINPDA